MQGSKLCFGLCLTKFYIYSSRCSPGIQTCTPTLLVGVGTNSVGDGNAHSSFYLCWSRNSQKTSDITSDGGDFPAASAFESSEVELIGIVCAEVEDEYIFIDRLCLQRRRRRSLCLRRHLRRRRRDLGFLQTKMTNISSSLSSSSRFKIFLGMGVRFCLTKRFLGVGVWKIR